MTSPLAAGTALCWRGRQSSPNTSIKCSSNLKLGSICGPGSAEAITSLQSECSAGSGSLSSALRVGRQSRNRINNLTIQILLMSNFSKELRWKLKVLQICHHSRNLKLIRDGVVSNSIACLDSTSLANAPLPQEEVDLLSLSLSQRIWSSMRLQPTLTMSALIYQSASKVCCQKQDQGGSSVYSKSLWV